MKQVLNNNIIKHMKNTANGYMKRLYEEFNAECNVFVSLVESRLIGLSDQSMNHNMKAKSQCMHSDYKDIVSTKMMHKSL